MAHSADPGRPYLIFSLLDKLYGVPALLARELIRLPEVTPIEEAPASVIGVVNLRGRVTPIMDLNLRLGRLPEPYRLSDGALVLSWEERVLGLVITEVQEVRALHEEEIDAPPGPEDSRETGRHIAFIAGVARVDEEMVSLLDVERLMRATPVNGDALELSTQEEHSDFNGLTRRRRFRIDATEEERVILRERARHLMRRTEQETLEGLLPLAVVRLNREYLAVDLNRVRGFAQIKQVTPIPCCPGHIVGSMNLRGDILTLLDIGPLLNIPTHTKDAAPNKAVVTALGEITVGILVHDIVDIIHLRPQDLAKAPTAGGAIQKEHLRGTAPYEKGMLSVLDLEKILTSPELVVEEEA